MRLLLDTHVVIWLAEGAEELSLESRKLILEHATARGLAVSSITFWEVAMLAERGRIALTTPVKSWRGSLLSQSGIEEEPVDGAIAIESVLLPGNLHADPADRLLVATARIKNWTLATRDAKLLEYAGAGHVRALRV